MHSDLIEARGKSPTPRPNEPEVLSLATGAGNAAGGTPSRPCTARAVRDITSRTWATSRAVGPSLRESRQQQARATTRTPPTPPRSRSVISANSFLATCRSAWATLRSGAWTTRGSWRSTPFALYAAWPRALLLCRLCFAFGGLRSSVARDARARLVSSHSDGVLVPLQTEGGYSPSRGGAAPGVDVAAARTAAATAVSCALPACASAANAHSQARRALSQARCGLVEGEWH